MGGVVHEQHALCQGCRQCVLCTLCNCEGSESLMKALSNMKVKDAKTPIKMIRCNCGVIFSNGSKSRHLKSFGHQIYDRSVLHGMTVEDLLEFVKATKDFYGGKKRNVKGLSNDDALIILDRNEWDTMSMMKEVVSDEHLQSLRKKKKVKEEIVSDEEDGDAGEDISPKRRINEEFNDVAEDGEPEFDRCEKCDCEFNQRKMLNYSDAAEKWSLYCDNDDNGDLCYECLVKWFDSHPELHDEL